MLTGTFRTDIFSTDRALLDHNFFPATDKKEFVSALVDAGVKEEKAARCSPSPTFRFSSPITTCDGSSGGGGILTRFLWWWYSVGDGVGGGSSSLYWSSSW